MNAYYQPPRFSISRLALAAMESAVSTAGAVVLPAERASGDAGEQAEQRGSQDAGRRRLREILPRQEAADCQLHPNPDRSMHPRSLPIPQLRRTDYHSVRRTHPFIRRNSIECSRRRNPGLRHRHPLRRPEQPQGNRLGVQRQPGRHRSLIRANRKRNRPRHQVLETYGIPDIFCWHEKSQCIYTYHFPFILKIVIFAAEADERANGLIQEAPQQQDFKSFLICIGHLNSPAAWTMLHGRQPKTNLLTTPTVPAHRRR